MEMSKKARILVVDDDRNLLKIICLRLETLGHAAVAVQTEQQAHEQVSNQQFDLAVVDLQLESGSGITLMEKLHQSIPDLPVIILTAFGSIESAVDAMKRGASSYLTKPFDVRELAVHIERALENRKLTTELKQLKQLLSDQQQATIIARSQVMRKVLEVVSQIALNDSTVYIHGASGTGKEVVARAIHLASPRNSRPFVAINCAALPENLLES